MNDAARKNLAREALLETIALRWKTVRVIEGGGERYGRQTEPRLRLIRGGK